MLGLVFVVVLVGVIGQASSAQSPILLILASSLSLLVSISSRCFISFLNAISKSASTTWSLF